jgi:hypothetical protein
MDPFGLSRIPTFEPKRGPAVPSFLAAEAGTGLVFMPVRGGPTSAVSDWLAALGPLTGEFTQNSLRQWKRAHPGHRSFAVLRHPVRRAWAAFRALVEGENAELRQLMRDLHRVPLPEDAALPGLSADQSQALFGDFLGFLKRNLSGQTTLSTHPGWASQTEVLAGFARFAVPDLLLREDRLTLEIGWLAASAGVDAAKAGLPATESFPDFLTDPAILKAAKAAYLRDYVGFGFDDDPA